MKRENCEESLHLGALLRVIVGIVGGESTSGYLESSDR